VQCVDTYGGPLLGIPPWYAGAGGTRSSSGGDLRRVYTPQHQADGGIALHARTLSGCLLNQAGARLVQQHFKASPETVRKVMAPYRDELVVAVECRGPWDGLADLCPRAGSAVGRGHALSRQASQGGHAKHDRLEAPTMAARLRGGLLPPASVDPAAMRATRALLRRRVPLLRPRAARLTPLQHTTSQDNRPELGQKLAATATRDGVAARCSAPAVPKRLDVDRARLGHSDARLRDVARSSRNAAQPHPANTRSRRRTGPGIGAIRSLGRRDALHAIPRCPRGQAVVSDGRLGKGAPEAAGTRDGTAGTQMGHASRTWAFSAAAGLCRRANPTGPTDLGRLENKPGQGQALPGWAPKLARAVYARLPRHPAFEMPTCLTGERSGVGAPGASLATDGISLAPMRGKHGATARGNAYEPVGSTALSPVR
jgi:hypothetical protein